MVPLPSQPKVSKKDKNLAVFEIEGLYPGYGITIGNSLRRALLSSLPGAAATQVKIKGVSHEFSTVPGVLEDVITIMLNLKQMRFKLFGDEPQKVTLKIKGEKEVKGSDLVLPSQVELINSNCHIATLTAKSSELEMEILVERGLGFRARENRKKGVPGQEKLEIGVIALDAIFTPIKKVSFKTENMRVGERTDYDRIYLEVETDGTIDPEDAFFGAADTMVKHFSVLSEAFKKAEEVLPAQDLETIKKKKIKQPKVSKKHAPKKSGQAKKKK